MREGAVEPSRGSDAGVCPQAVLTIAMVSLSETKDGVVSTVCWQYVLRVFLMGIRR